MNREESEQARILMCELGDHIRDSIAQARTRGAASSFSDVSRESLADTIYHIDKISEEAIAFWFEQHWPAEWPVEIVMEGADAHTFPAGTPLPDTDWKCIIDPIDGTRGIMYDKRSAWALAALAPQRGSANRLPDLFVAAMTELPVTKQWRADQISAVRGQGIIAEQINVSDQSRVPLRIEPSKATDFKHGFASFVRFFPEGKALSAWLEERLWDELYGLGSTRSPLVFDDQYICSAGQFHELLAGHDRMTIDLRPMIYKACGFESALVSHPYDVCTALILEEAGVIIETPEGATLAPPLDTTSPVAWAGYANETLASQVRPILRRLMDEIPAMAERLKYRH